MKFTLEAEKRFSASFFAFFKRIYEKAEPTVPILCKKILEKAAKLELQVP